MNSDQSRQPIEAPQPPKNLAEADARETGWKRQNVMYVAEVNLGNALRQNGVSIAAEQIKNVAPVEAYRQYIPNAAPVQQPENSPTIDAVRQKVVESIDNPSPVEAVTPAPEVPADVETVTNNPEEAAMAREFLSQVWDEDSIDTEVTTFDDDEPSEEALV